MHCQSQPSVVVHAYWHLVLTRQQVSTFYDFTKFCNFHEVAIWLAPEHSFWSRCFIAIFVSGALGPTKQHFTAFGKSSKIMDFQELFLWLAREHYFSRLLGALGGCWRLLGAPWAPMAALGGPGGVYENHGLIKQNHIFFPRSYS